MRFTRHIPLNGSYNIRDLGGYPTATGPTAWRRILRADSLHRLDDQAMLALHEMGCDTVIDLRRTEETTAQPNPFATAMPQVQYHNISLFEGLDPLTTVDTDSADLLLDIYRLALTERGAEFATILRIIAQAEGAVLFHCTAGKDRTGMIAALLLLLAGATRDTVIADYALTGDYAPAMFTALHAEVLAAGGAFDLSSPLLLCNPATMEALLHDLHDQHGGAEAYLLRHGLTETELAALRARLSDIAEQKGAA